MRSVKHDLGVIEKLRKNPKTRAKVGAFFFVARVALAVSRDGLQVIKRINDRVLCAGI